MSKRKTPAQALEEFLTGMLAIRSLKRTSASRTFFMKWNLPRTGTKGTGLQQAFNRAEEPGGLIKIWQR